jgi:N-methylhydantoinase A/oxoprolinase/acetone carboxylase beta subunit
LNVQGERFRIAVDIGGTFTDCVVVDAGGNRTISKAPTTPDALEQGVLDAVAVNASELGLSRRELLERTDLFVHGTTQATNALLTRTGARAGLIATRGHEDNLLIGRVYAKMAGLPERDLVHASRLEKPDPIIPRERIFGITERIDREGEVIIPLDEQDVVAAIDALLEDGVEAIAVSLLWSFANETHEQRVKELLAERAGGVFAALSHEIAPVLGEYERTATTAITAYVGPKVVGYLTSLESRLQDEGLGRPLLVMQASGGLTSVDDASQRPIVTLDSGPTGGVLGCQHLGRLYGEQNVVCTDVGGTSFDVGLILRGQVPLDAEPVVAQYSLRTPKILVHSIGSGGGSIAWIDEGGLLRVGPQSAGSRPGPACYGLGGTEPTVTDADLVLGYLSPDNFLGGRMQLDRELALKALGELGARLGMEPEEAAVGVFRIINSQMADLVRASTIEQGQDPRQCVLVAYGGAGPTHAVFYGHDIGSKAILVPADSTVYSAEGMLTCDITHAAEVSRAVSSPFGADAFAAIRERFAMLSERVLAQFEREGAARDEITLEYRLGVRFQAQVQGLEIAVQPEEFDSTGDWLLERFLARYAEVYGRGALLSGGGIEVELHRVVGTRPIEPLVDREHEETGPDPSAALKGERSAWFAPDGLVTTRVYAGDELRAGHVVEGPAVIERMGDSVVVPAGHEARVDRYLTLRLGEIGQGPAGAPAATAEAVS